MGRKMLPPSTSLPVMGKIAGVNTASLGVVRRLEGPDGRKGSTTNSTATCSTWRGREGSVRLHIALESPWNDHQKKNRTIPDRSPPGSTRTAPSAVHHDGGVKYATGESSKIRGRDNITIGTWNTRTLRAAGKLQELSLIHISEPTRQ